MNTELDYSLPMDRLLKRFAKGRFLASWKRLTTPIRKLTDPELYQEVRILSSLLIVIFLIAFFGMPSHLLQPEAVPGTHTARLILHGLNCLFIATSYLLVRHARTTTALALFIVSWSVEVYAESWLLQGSDHYVLLYAMILPVFILSLFRSTRSGTVLAVVQVAAIILLPLLKSEAAATLAPAFSLALVSLLVLAISNAGRHIQMVYRSSIALREERYRELFNSVTDLVVIVDSTGEILQANRSAQRLFGWTSDDLAGHKFHEYVHPDDLVALAQAFQNGVEMMVDGRPSPLVEGRVRTRAGAYRWMEFNSTPHVVDGAVRMFTTTARDIGERKQTEANRLKIAVEREQWTLLQKFVASISHDFRTSLSNIETNRYLIERALEPEQGEALAPRMDVIRKQVSRLNEQLENLQFVTSLKASRTVHVDMESIARQVVSDLAMVAAEKQVTVVTEIEPTVSPVNGDGEYLYRAVRHLVSNSITASKFGGQIELALKQIEDCVIIQMHNTGPEISTADLERIFEPFYRVDNARSISQGGIGIGLTLVKMVAETYGGSVAVESNPECGTSFTIKLPAIAHSV
ncbi:MAG: PAS domain S-box protein [Anaerolineae bacterium]|nr:PAS domain S-box protein [Anaerolineae bacterium]